MFELLMILIVGTVIWIVGSLLLDMPELIVVLVVVGIVVGMCSSDVKEKIEEEIEATEEVVTEPGPIVDESVAKVEDSVKEKCIDGITYLLITEDGKNYVTAKEDTFGYNEKCYE